MNELLAKNALHFDDCWQHHPQALSVACFSFFAALTHIEVGHHVEYFTYVRPDHRKRFFEISWWYAWILVAAYSSIKISIACFLLRFADHRRHWQWSLYAMIGASINQQWRCELISLSRSHFNPVHHWIRSLIGIAMFTHSSSMGLQFAAAYRVRSWHRIEKKHAHYDRNANCYSTTTFRNTGVFNSGTFAMNHCIAATDMECQCLTSLLISSSLYHPCPLYGRYRQIYELKSHYASSWDSVYCTYLKTSGDASMVS